MKINQFLETVTNQIRSKEAKTYVKDELTQHILKSKQVWLQKGCRESDAEEKAVQELGSPLTLGQSLNQLHKPKVDWLLISLLVITLLLSFLPIFALTQVQYTGFFDLQTMIQNKVIFTVVGLLVAIGMMNVDYRKLQKFGYLFYAAGIGLILMLHFFSNTQVNGEVMLSIGPLNLQIWMAVPLFLIAWSALLARQSFKIWQAISLFIISLLLFSSVANLSIFFIYVVLVGVLFLQSQFSRKEKLLVFSGVGTLAVGFVIFTVISYLKGIIKSYQFQRLFGFLNPEEHADSSGFMYVLLEKSLRNASWFGAKTQISIPQAHTDLVLGHVVQSFGYLMGLFIILILSVFATRICYISLSIKDSFGKLLVIGGVTLFSTQFLYSIGMTVGLLPIVSIPLPFMSYGFMPTVLNAFIVGITLSVYRRKLFIQIKKQMA